MVQHLGADSGASSQAGHVDIVGAEFAAIDAVGLPVGTGAEGGNAIDLHERILGHRVEERGGRFMAAGRRAHGERGDSSGGRRAGGDGHQARVQLAAARQQVKASS